MITNRTIEDEKSVVEFPRPLHFDFDFWVLLTESLKLLTKIDWELPRQFPDFQ